MLSLIFLLATTLSTQVTKVDEQTLNFKNVEFVHSYCILNNPTVPDYPANTIFTTIADFRSENLALWEFIPYNILANNPLLWSQPFTEPNPLSTYDWRTHCDWNLVFPENRIYWMYYRSYPILESDIGSYVLDTRLANLSPPKYLSAMDMGNGNINVSWRNSSFGPNITNKLTISKLTGSVYVFDREITTQPNNVSSLDFKLPIGTYKIDIIAVGSVPAMSISFTRPVPVSPNQSQDMIQTVNVAAVTKQAKKQEPIIITLVSRPIAPDKFMLTNRYTDNSLRFIWSDNSDNESHFLLTEQKFVNNIWVNHSSTVIAANVVTYTIPARIPGSAYRYAIRAVNVSGTSAYSRWIVSEAR